MLIALLWALPAWANTLEAGTGGVSTLFVAETALPDWGDNMIAWWSLDENGTTDRVAAGTCGSGCNLVESGSIPNDSSIKQEGSASNYWNITEGDVLACTDANCSALERAGSGDHSLTWGTWLYPDIVALGTSLMEKGPFLGTTGFMLNLFDPASIQCWIDTTSRLGGVLVASDWVHVACVFNDSASTVAGHGGDTLTTYTDVVPSSEASVSAMTENASDFTVSVFGTPMRAHLDEMFVYAGAMSTASICRICSCGISGSLCKCGSGPSTTNFSSTGRNGSECGACTLPADCTAAAPS